MTAAKDDNKGNYDNPAEAVVVKKIAQAVHIFLRIIIW